MMIKSLEDCIHNLGSNPARINKILYYRYLKNADSNSFVTDRISSDLYVGLFCLVGATRAAVDAGFVPNELQVRPLMILSRLKF